MATICLNMIVKNESKIITRLFDSVIDIIDSYCICDTGSTDNTVDIIESYFHNKSIPGKVVHEKFVDFEHNRNFALRSCSNMERADYILLLDADMIMMLHKNLDIQVFKNNLPKHTAYYIFQGSESFFYKNVRIVKNTESICYWGVTHEYIKLPDANSCGIIEKHKMFINDVGDGGSKTDKFERDILLLEEGLRKHPGNDRYTFYLANSYKNSNQFEKAIEVYKNRVDLGGWFEEIWYSHYSIGNCYAELGNMNLAIFHWLEAVDVDENRIENIFKIVNHYRNQGKNKIAYEFFRMADERRSRIKNWDMLFLEKNIYSHLLDYELSIIGYYFNKHNYNLYRCCMNLMAYNHIESWMYFNILSNYKFYSPIIKGEDISHVFSPPACAKDGFTNSTPSICIHNDNVVINTRFVNYKIDERGHYINQEKIETINVLSKYKINYLDSEIGDNVGYEKVENSDVSMIHDVSRDNMYVGPEDVRLFSYSGLLCYNANRGFPSSFSIEHGNICLENGATESNLLSVENQRPIEKNWVMFENGFGDMKCIYGWHPLIIGTITEDNRLVKTQTIPTVRFFKDVRCSTNGVTIGNEIWFICHLVSYEDRRHYYHLFVAIDKYNYKVNRYTSLFTFEGEKVEYTLGFIQQNGGKLIIGYSTMDRTTKYKMVEISHVVEMFEALGFQSD